VSDFNYFCFIIANSWKSVNLVNKPDLQWELNNFPFIYRLNQIGVGNLKEIIIGRHTVLSAKKNIPMFCWAQWVIYSHTV